MKNPTLKNLKAPHTTPDHDLFNGTSFHSHMIKATVKELTKALGDPIFVQNDGSDKVNIEWMCILTHKGTKIPFTVYDWKEYRKIKYDEPIDFHIGAHSSDDAFVAFEYLHYLLGKI